MKTTDSQFALKQMEQATWIGDGWNADRDEATLNDVMCAFWALTSAVFFVGRQLALSNEKAKSE